MASALGLKAMADDFMSDPCPQCGIFGQGVFEKGHYPSGTLLAFPYTERYSALWTALSS